MPNFSSVRKLMPAKLASDAENAVELDGMADGFVNLQAELGAFENDGAFALGHWQRGMERDGLLGYAGRVSDQIESIRRARIPASWCWPPKRLGEERFWISSFLKLYAAIPAPRTGACLIDNAAER